MLHLIHANRERTAFPLNSEAFNQQSSENVIPVIGWPFTKRGGERRRSPLQEGIRSPIVCYGWGVGTKAGSVLSTESRCNSGYSHSAVYYGWRGKIAEKRLSTYFGNFYELYGICRTLRARTMLHNHSAKSRFLTAHDFRTNRLVSVLLVRLPLLLPGSLIADSMADHERKLKGKRTARLSAELQTQSEIIVCNTLCQFTV